MTTSRRRARDEGAATLEHLGVVVVVVLLVGQDAERGPCSRVRYVLLCP